jgi:hypothetical protein
MDIQIKTAVVTDSIPDYEEYISIESVMTRFAIENRDYLEKYEYGCLNTILDLISAGF